MNPQDLKLHETIAATIKKTMAWLAEEKSAGKHHPKCACHYCSMLYGLMVAGIHCEAVLEEQGITT
jgi:hypothetical protein